MPTIACCMQLLRPGEQTRARRRVCRTNHHVVEGVGYSIVGGERLDWEDTDVFTVPTWNEWGGGLDLADPCSRPDPLLGSSQSRSPH